MNWKTDLRKALQLTAKDWKNAKDKDDREARREMNRAIRMRSTRTTIKDVAFDVMEQAYLKASGNGRYYANARQIMYAARPEILRRADADELDDVYFTQTLLKDYLLRYKPSWKVAWDARGTLIEPHTRQTVQLGGVGVREYWGAWISNDININLPQLPEQIATSGPKHRFSNVLFVEKEGFDTILTDAGIPEKFDMALMSTKGIPTDAACDLIDRMATEHDVRVFVLHDFDKDGFKILNTLREGTKLSVGSDVIDLGLRIDDIEGLVHEPVTYKQDVTPKGYLRSCGAAEDECSFLVSGGRPGYWRGERVEINAMASDQLIEWLEHKLTINGAKKVAPESSDLQQAWKRARFAHRMQAEMQRLRDEMEDEEPPDDLETEFTQAADEEQSASWDRIIWRMAALDED